ncbi:MAG: DNA helicase RecQ, partial [Oscillospiraceae bacterium]|nr:DNA helicase RecQ [Oscillospiraceae bacterium]
MDKLTVLREYFGYCSFRDGQEQLIDAVLSGRDVFGIMPTGGGKSLCYQVPAMLLRGVTFVVSPLISLMQDQVTALKEAGVPAAYINSTLTFEQMRAVFANIRAGRYKIIYVAPERLGTQSLQGLAREVPIDLVAVDEAHCISQWGQDFRPSYLKIVDFVSALNRRPVVAAFTATATDTVRKDVTRILGLKDPLCVITGFDRPNLSYEVCTDTQKDAQLLRLLLAKKGQSGIIYCATRKSVESVCDGLCRQGIGATRYHAGLSEEERRRNQEDFVYDRKPVMVATNAFGMGIDKSNVRYVIHYNMPQSLEAYYQEAGRAGRDGEPADCVLLYSAGDVTTARYLIEHGEENRELSAPEQRRIIRQNLRRLQIMVDYCKTRECLRGYILDYFGQDHDDTCGNCSNCLGEYEQADITTQSQMILSCVKRIENTLGYNVGATLVIDTLRGSREQRIRDLGLDGLTTYGIMRQVPKKILRCYIDALEQEGYLYTDPTYRALRITARANEVLFHAKRVSIKLRREEKPRISRRVLRKGELSRTDTALFDKLRALRRELAEAEGIAAFMIFSDATLRDMA